MSFLFNETTLVKKKLYEIETLLKCAKKENTRNDVAMDQNYLLKLEYETYNNEGM